MVDCRPLASNSQVGRYYRESVASKLNKSMLLLPCISTTVLILVTYDRVADAQTQTSSVPGDASWLGDYGDGDGTPPIEDYLPFTYSIYGEGGSVISRILVLANQTCPEVVTTTNDGNDDNLPQVKERATGSSD